MKQFWKRTMSCLLLAALVCSLLPAGIRAETAEQVLYLPMEVQTGASLLELVRPEPGRVILVRDSHLPNELPVKDVEPQVLEQQLAGVSEITLELKQDGKLIQSFPVDTPKAGKKGQLAMLTNISHGTLEGLEPGAYTMEFTLKKSTYTIGSGVTILGYDQAAIHSMELENMTVGSTEVRVRLRVAGLLTKTDLAPLSLEVLKDQKVISKPGDGRMELDRYNVPANCWNLTMPIALTEAISLSGTYVLKLTYTGAKQVLDLTDLDPVSGELPRPTLVSASVNNPQTGRITLVFTNLKKQMEYQVQIYSGKELLAEQAFEAGGTDDFMQLQLQRSMEQLEENLKVVIICSEGRFESTFRNAYVQFTKTIYASPTRFDPDQGVYAFTLSAETVPAGWKGSGDAVTMRSPDGTQVGRCEALVVDRQDRGGFVVHGEMPLTGSFEETAGYTLQLNGRTVEGRLSVARSLDELRTYLPYKNGEQFFTNFGEFPVQMDLFHAADAVRLQLKQAVKSWGSTEDVVKGQDPIWESPVLEGLSLPNQAAKRYSAVLTFTDEELQKLAAQNACSIWVTDGVESILLERKVSYSGSHTALEEKPTCFEPMDQETDGSTTMTVRLNYEGLSNLTEADLEKVRTLPLQKGKKSLEITDYQIEKNWKTIRGEQVYEVLLQLQLSGPLTAGTWTLGTYPFPVVLPDERPWLESFQPETGKLTGSGFGRDHTYSCDLMQNMQKVNEEPIVLTLPGEEAVVSTLYFPAEALAGLELGTYTLRLYQDDDLICGEVTFTVMHPLQAEPILTVGVSQEADGFAIHWSIDQMDVDTVMVQRDQEEAVGPFHRSRGSHTFENSWNNHVYTVIATDYSGRELRKTVDCKAEIWAGSSNMVLRDRQVLAAPVHGSTTYELVLPKTAEIPVWTVEGGPVEGVAVSGSDLTLEAGVAGQKLLLKAVAGERTVYLPVTICRIPDYKLGCYNYNDMLQLSMTMPKDMTIPVRAVLVRYDSRGRMVEMKSSGVLLEGAGDADGKIKLELSAENGDTGCAMLLDARTGEPLVTAAHSR